MSPEIQPRTWPKLTVVHLYPHEMDINGDYGNLLVLLKRLQWRGIPVERVRYNVGDEFPAEPDLIFGAGGEVSAESAVQRDLLRLKERIGNEVEGGAAVLALGGTYQLFGRSIKNAEGEEIEGLGIFDMVTVFEGERFTGNVVAESERFGTVVGFENHSGKSYIGRSDKPFARVLSGNGNNAKDNGEGVQLKSTIGSYLYGPLLPKNPAIADFLIAKALEHKLGSRLDTEELAPLTEIDECAARAAIVARSRIRGEM
ncbi:MAG TPA: glutamine amidotransferase [Coriobacteriia bacterium]|nr:glutamine amidotransferase [Coriobacteriia bacterium]